MRASNPNEKQEDIKMAKDKFEKYVIDTDSAIACYSFATIKLMAKRVLRERNGKFSNSLELYSRRTTRQSW